MTLSKLTIPFLIATLSATAWAADGWERNSAYNQRFNPATVSTWAGTVEKIDRDAHPMKGMEPGFSAILKTTSGERLEVQVGPAWFTGFYRQKWNVKTGDKVTITGSKVTIDHHDVVMVVTGQKNNLKMTVRGKSGTPVWDLDVDSF